MAIGRLLWRTPTGAMLWEIWGRHKFNFLWQSIALAASVIFVNWKAHVASQNLAETLSIASFCCFVGAYCHLLICLGYFEVDAGSVQLSFPARLLLKPVTTTRLVLVPMLVGGIITVTVFVLWAELVWQHLMSFSASDLLWICIVQMSFYWWLQTLAWSLPLPKIRLLLMVAVSVIHLLVWRMRQMHAYGDWPWLLMTGLLASAAMTAWIGLRFVRRGAWESPPRLPDIWSLLHLTRTSDRRRKFGTAFSAQFWLEWRRQGWLLPTLSGGMAVLTVATFQLTLFVVRKNSGGGWQGGDADSQSLLNMFMLPLVFLPLVLSVLLAPFLAKFDRFHTSNELPNYIAIRPMTNGGFVMAKLSMALATSVLTWAVTVGACLWLALMEKQTLFSASGLITPYGPLAYITGCVPLFLLLVIWTWKNLVAGIGAGLAGNTWIGLTSVYCRLAFLVGMIPLAGTLQTNADFREALWHWFPAIVFVCLAVKLATSATAFTMGLRRHTVTRCTIAWIIGGWFVCGLFVATCANRVCHTLHKPEVWIWVALAGFLVLPLADLAIAPLALAWNRHR